MDNYRNNDKVLVEIYAISQASSEHFVADDFIQTVKRAIIY